MVRFPAEGFAGRQLSLAKDFYLNRRGNIQLNKLLVLSTHLLVPFLSFKPTVSNHSALGKDHLQCFRELNLSEIK
jgi:hypothetical protein